MASDSEGVEDAKIRVFKWNEVLPNLAESEGLLMVRFKNTTTAVEQEEEDCDKFTFCLHALTTREGTEYLVSQVIRSRESFPEETAAKLRKHVSDYLLSCFQFNVQPQPPTPSPTILIIVDVYMSKPTRKRYSDFSSVFSSRRQVTESSKNDVSTGSESVKRIKFVHARMYKNEIKSRLQKKVSFEEEDEIRGAWSLSPCWGEGQLGFAIKPVVKGEPKGLIQVVAEMKVRKFDGGELAAGAEAEENVCAICMGAISRDMVVAKTPCCHLFHRGCLFKWLPKKNSCPMCRSVCATLI